MAEFMLPMLAALEAPTKEMRAQRIVFDPLDMELAPLLPGPAEKRRFVSLFAALKLKKHRSLEE